MSMSARVLRFDEGRLRAGLEDGRIPGMPLAWFSISSMAATDLRATTARLEELRAGSRLDGLAWKDLRDDGRP
jgi:hypothetical protein